MWIFQHHLQIQRIATAVFVQHRQKRMHRIVPKDWKPWHIEISYRKVLIIEHLQAIQANIAQH
jgi:hypothetical protein